MRIVGTAKVGTLDVRHPAIPADDMTQAFALHHFVPALELMVDVLPR